MAGLAIISILIIILLFAVVFLLMIFVEDDTRLKVMFYLIVFLFGIAIIGVWENFLKPLLMFLGGYIAPAIPGALNIFK